MILLVAARHGKLERYPHPNLGRLFTPRLFERSAATAALMPWAADNDAFNGFDPEKFRQMIAALRDLPRGLFVAVPDVVGDAAATLRSYERWCGELEGLPLAYVAQDNSRPAGIPWEEISALFIGGTDTFKLGPEGERMSRAARDRGKWLHVGRVNSYRRMRYCATLHADSVDGSQWPRFDAVYLRSGLAAVGAPRQPRLGEA